MTDYWIDFTGTDGETDSGTGTEIDPFTSPYAARTAFATGGNIFHVKGRYVRLKPVSGNGRYIQVLASGTARAPSIMHGYDPAHPAEWWAGCMLRATADSGPTWTDDTGGVFHTALGYSFGGGETKAGHLLWYYDMTDQSVPPRQLTYAKDETGGAHAGVDATEDSFWLDTATNTLWVHLRSGESPDGKIMLPANSDSTNSWGDQWGGYPDNFFRNRENIVFSNFSYVYCGTRPWDASNVYAGGGHKVKNFEMWRGKFGYTWRTDAVIRPINTSQAFVIDECELRCGGIGIIYTYAGSSTPAADLSTNGNVLVGLRVTRCLLIDAGYTHRGQGDGHGAGSQASASDWGLYGNHFQYCVKTIDFWHTSNLYAGNTLKDMITIGNLIENQHNSGIATGIRCIEMENIPSVPGGRELWGHTVSKNVCYGAVERVANGYYNGTIFTGEGTKSCISYNLADADYAPDVDGNICIGGNVAFLNRLNSANTEIGMHWRWNIATGQDTYSVQHTYSGWPAGPNDVIMNFNTYSTAIAFGRAGSTTYNTKALYVAAIGQEASSSGGL